jgi:ribosomal protein S18 acetylase RimI-like enzyme
MTLAIAPAVPRDAPLLRELVELVINDTFRHDETVRLDILGNVHGNIDVWLARPHESVMLKAVAGTAIAGMVQVKEFWNLCSLYVHPAHQRQGRGEALLEAACAQCRGKAPKDAILLNAAPDAIGFYRRLGFVEREATRPLPPGALAMQRPL